MKQRFLAFIQSVKETGLAETVTRASNAKELNEVWEQFSKDNKQLCRDIKDWAEEYKTAGVEILFRGGETIENPIEIVEIIRIIDDPWVSEEELIENLRDLLDALGKLNTKYAERVAGYIYQNNLLSYIEAEILFEDD